MHVFAFRPFIPLVLAGLNGKQKRNKFSAFSASGDYKLSNYNTIPYLRIRVLSQNLNYWFFIDRGYSFVILNNIDGFAKSRHSGENRSPETLQLIEKTGFRLSPE